MNTFLLKFLFQETIPVYFNQIPGGTSLRTMTFLTESSRNRFRKYDYGIGKNRHLYGTDEPPEYDLKKIKVPIYIMFATNDWSISRQVNILLNRNMNFFDTMFNKINIFEKFT